MENLTYENKMLKFRKKLFILYYLNILDIIYTKILLKTGYVQEINGIMNNIMHTPLIWILKIIVFPLVLLFWLFITKRGKEKKFKISNSCLNVCVIAYFIINLMHLFNFLLYYFFALFVFI